MKSKVIICLLMLFAGTSLFAQKISVSGTVSDQVSATRLPILGTKIEKK